MYTSKYEVLSQFSFKVYFRSSVSENFTDYVYEVLADKHCLHLPPVLKNYENQKSSYNLARYLGWVYFMNKGLLPCESDIS